ncbi:hypothetical protein CW745_02880 [Psychromonas sp. psych-6C06]|uniref:hypothetical protein n=1 Tax=Psychromonas sp. psych-6C06 TaxID=2058089 RepID=UPI000C334ED4|nr:hypothetical protein [Psychromonas sp. psych-6C06]PKF63799.1 hypothetical protein CW745_02880 [Psychromonas sp. psych-6C06]
MAAYNASDVADLLRQIGAHDQLLADAYVYGTVTELQSESRKIASLHKSGLLRPDDELGDYRITAELKRMLNRLMRKQSSYRQLSDMGKVIDTLDDMVKDYRLSVQSNQQDDAEYYLDQLDDLLYEAKDNLNVSLENMHHAISSQFGFVSTLSAKVRENERALAYAQKLLTELQQVDPETCYEWADWACPSDFARKISGFVYWFNQTLPRLRFIIDNMRLSLFRLRRDEKQASLLRNMARYLHQHPEFEISDSLFEDEQLPQALKFAPPMPLKSYVDTRNSEIETPLVALVQALRKPAQSSRIVEREVSDLDVTALQEFVIDHDYFEEQTEHLFEQVIKHGMPISALQFWENALKSWINEEQLIEPTDWVELVFSSYCKLTNDQQDAIDIKPKGALVSGTTDNYTYSDVVVLLR